MRNWISVAVVGLLAVLLAAWCSPAAAQATSKPAAAGVVVLDTMGFWRMHHALKPPAVQEDSGVKPYLKGVSWLDQETAPAPANWREANFDDGSAASTPPSGAWVRGTALRSCITPYLARLCLRGKFLVTEASAVKGLVLSVNYQGGAVVYLNGQEVGRGDLPAGEVGEATLANPYPLDAYVDEEGNLLAEEATYTGQGQKAGKPSADAARRIGLRVRGIQNLALPAKLLRKGVNVLAIEVFRAPYHKVLLEKDGEGGSRRYNRFDWSTCQIKRVQLTAAGAEGLAPNAVRPDGLQVWNSEAMASDTDLDWGDSCETLQPIQLVGARNGRYSGKVVVGSTTLLRDLKAAASDLKGDGGVIPAANVTVRYGLAGGEEVGTSRGGAPHRTPYLEGANLFGLVGDKPAEVAVRKVTAPQRGGAVAPVWVSVKIPKDAKPGAYSGTLTIQVRDGRPIPAAICVRVADWTLPDPQDYHTWVDLIEVPDTLAVEYNVPLWSEKHMAMIAHAFAAMSDSGSRTVYVPAIAHTNLGNAESMIRWIRKPSGQFEWDFSVMDQYLDLAQKHLGTPKMVCLQVWDIYMSSKESAGKRLADLGIGSGPQVTVLDPATGETKLQTLPKLSDPSSKAVWGALLSQVRERLRKRGIEKALMLGMVTDAVPTKEDVQFFHDLAPDLPWVQQGHGLYEKNQKVQGIGVLGYQATVWGAKFSDGQQAHGTTDKVRMQGWKRDILVADFERFVGEDSHPTTRWRLFGETNITGKQRGMGRIGADYWQAIKDKNGRRVAWMHNRFPEGAWGTGGSMNLNLCNPVLGPGPDGPEATHRLLALAEGVQECEARTCLERALDDAALKARLGADLVKRCQECLDEREACMWKGLSNLVLGGPVWGGAAWRYEPGVAGHVWFLGSGWQERSARLYSLAGEVTRKIEQKQ